ncbi:hypothetical protein G6F22_015177 [Rhizopus arrhizus]|nr:hypothetical protein G6F22_015177 [Rhizopus arrhizus]
MAQIVFRHFRVDPDVVDGDQRHHRVTGGGELTDIGAQGGDQARRSGAHLRVRQIQFCLFHGGRGAAQLGVVFLVAALLFARPLHFRPRRCDLADGLRQVRPRDLQPAQRNRALVVAVQALESAAVLARPDLIGLCRTQRRLRGIDAGRAGADLPARRLQVCAGAVQGDPVMLRIHFEQDGAGLDVLVVPHMHLGHAARYLRGHGYDKGLHARLLRVRREPVGQQIPHQAHHDQQADPPDALPGGVGRRWRRRSRGRR